VAAPRSVTTWICSSPRPRGGRRTTGASSRRDGNSCRRSRPTGLRVPARARHRARDRVASARSRRRPRVRRIVTDLLACLSNRCREAGVAVFRSLHARRVVDDERRAHSVHCRAGRTIAATASSKSRSCSRNSGRRSSRPPSPRSLWRARSPGRGTARRRPAGADSAGSGTVRAATARPPTTRARPGSRARTSAHSRVGRARRARQYEVLEVGRGVVERVLHAGAVTEAADLSPVARQVREIDLSRTCVERTSRSSPVRRRPDTRLRKFRARARFGRVCESRARRASRRAASSSRPESRRSQQQIRDDDRAAWPAEPTQMTCNRCAELELVTGGSRSRNSRASSIRRRPK